MENPKKDIAQSDPDSQERRSALKKLGIGVGVLAGISVLPEKWTQPIVGEIVLPAHAQTSGSSLNDPCSIETVYASGGRITFTVNGYVTPPTPNLAVTIVVTPTSGGIQNRSTTTAADGTYSEDFDYAPAPSSISVTATLLATGESTTCNWSCAADEPGGTCFYTTVPAE